MGVLARLSWLGIAREALPGVPAAPVAAVPVDAGGYEPEDTPGWLMDQGLRASMGSVAGVIQGTLTSALAFGGSFYPDSGGWWLDNLLGDLSSTSNGTLGTAQPLALPVSAGDTQLTASASLGTVVPGSVVQISDGAASELVVATAGSTGTTVQFAGTPARFPHSTSAAASLETSAVNYNHAFSALNSGSGQPSTHTLTDTTGLTAATGARCYPSATVAQLQLAGDPGKGWVTAKVTGAAWLSQPASATTAYPSAASAFAGWSSVPAQFVPGRTTPGSVGASSSVAAGAYGLGTYGGGAYGAGSVAAVSPGAYVAPFAGWQSMVLVGGTLAFAGAWQLTLTRPLVIYRGAQNTAQPVWIARGGLTVTGTLDYPDPSDETPLSQILNGTQPSVQIAISNGLPGPAAASLTITCSTCQFTKAKPDRERVALAYATGFQAIDSSANAGGSGGLSPVQVSLTNQVAAY